MKSPDVSRSRKAPVNKACPTMQDVATAAGCSRATVSLAFRGDPSIPEATRKRVCMLAERLGYRMNPMVASLMSLRRRRLSSAEVTTKIAYLTTHPADNPWRNEISYREMFAGASERALEFGCGLEEFNLAQPGMTPRRMREIIDARGIRGVIVAPLPGGAVSIDFDFDGLVAVGLGMSLISPLLERVANDHSQSAALALRKGAELGYRRIGFALAQETSVRLEHRWLAGYMSECVQVYGGVPVPPLIPPLKKDVRAQLPGWIKRHRVDAVLLGNSEPEMQAVVSRETGLIVLGVHDPKGAITGIYQNCFLIGRSVFDRAISLLHTNNHERITQPVMHLVGGVWVEGRTALGPGRRRDA